MYTKYKLDLWVHRAQKRGILMPSDSSMSSGHPLKHEVLQPQASSFKQEAPQHHAAGSVPLKVEADGSLTVHPRGPSLLMPKNADCLRMDDDFTDSVEEENPDASSLKKKRGSN